MYYMIEPHYLAEWINPENITAFLATVPILKKFFLMKRSPFQYHRPHSIRHFARNNPDRRNGYDEFEFSINSMKMRRIMIREKHPNYNSIEFRNSRHIIFLIPC